MQTDASAAIVGAARWAAPFWIRRKTFREAVTSTEQDVLSTGRIRWRGRSRRIESRYCPTISSARKLQEPCRPHEFDPWHDESATLPGRTLRLICCPACDGTKNVACPVCVGQSSTLCGDCAGTGRSYSTRSRRMIRCPGCRGAGRRKCSCRSGQVPCEACAGRGKVDSWLEVSEDAFDRTEWTEENALSRDLAGGRIDSTQALPERRWSGASMDDAPADLQTLLRRSQGFRSLDSRRDKVHAVEIDLYRLAVERVHYQLCGIQGFVEVQEWDLRILENPGSREPLKRRQRRITLGVLGTASAGFLLALIYGLRHPYFTTVANYRWLWGGICLPGRRASR